MGDGVDSCIASVAAGGCTLTLTTAGARTLRATYLGNLALQSSTSAEEAHTVNGLATSSAITAADPDPSVVGEPVTVHYTVSPSDGDGTPTGNVTVSDGTTSCTATVAAGQCALAFASTGARSLTASYAGDSTFAASTSAAEPHTVNRANTTTTISADTPDSSVTGQAVTVHYDVAPSAPGTGTPTGNVTVSDGSVSCTDTVAAGGCTLTFTSAGTKQLTATYNGGDAFNASTSSVETHAVSRATTVTTLTADGPDLTTKGTPVTVRYSVTVSAPGAGTPTGTVRVSDGVDSCTATVAAGRCTIALTTVGGRTLTAAYAGDGNFSASSSSGWPHTVSPPSSSGGAPPTGNPTGGQPPTANPASTPLAHVSDASQTHPRFRVSAKRQLVQISRRRAPAGTTFKYTLDTAASVRFDFTKRGTGRVQRGSLTFAGHAGLNTVRFKGWLSRTKKLTAGKYTLTITAITPGVGETSQQLRFRIVR